MGTQSKLNVIPISMREANEFVIKLHRHSKKVRGCKFCLGAILNDKLVGVIIVGRPVSRRLDDRFTAEVLRTCTDGTKNVNSFLYGKAWNIWQQMGGTKILTYTLSKESGISLRASGYVAVSKTKPFPKGKGWTTREGREWQSKVHSEEKIRWEKQIT
tara:strand:+ start:134 stop:607 length:474 start_codon:yes stop_codon:yes gene_type:complete